MDDKQERRVEVLLEWRDRAQARGRAVPTEADTAAIGASGLLFPDGVDVTAAEPWRETITHLFKLLRRNMPDPVSMLPEDLWDPAPVNGWAPRPGPDAAPPRPAPPQPDPLLAALRAWYDAEPADGPLRTGITVVTLEKIARGAARGRRSAVDVARHLPVDQHDLADEIAAVIDTHAPSDTNGRTPRPTERHTAPAPEERAAGRFDGLELAPAQAGTPVGEIGEIEVRRVADGGFRLDWRAAPAAPALLYRVVAADGTYPPDVPQDSAEVARTEEPHCVDRRPFRWAVRHLQVWYHAGRTPEEAAATPPVLLAQRAVVAPLTAPRVARDGGRVGGNWIAPPGAKRVRIQRARHEPGLPPRFREIRVAEDNLRGFTDTDVEQGSSYTYDLRVEADVEAEAGRRTEESAEERTLVEIPVPLLPITDLQVTRSPSGVDLAWNTPHPLLEVRIYRTVYAPALRLTEGPVPVEELPRHGLAHEWILPNEPVAAPDGTTVMTDVAWPEGGSSHAYFTPVTLRGGHAAVGRSQIRVNLPPVAACRIVERVFKQVLTFDWPDGAHSVAYRHVPRSTLAALPDGSAEGLRKPEYVGRREYEEHGGTVLHLPPTGCAVIMAPVSHHMGKQHLGDVVSIDYPGLLRLKYGVLIRRDESGAAEEVYLTIVSERPGPSDLHFTLLSHPDRLPLHLNDRQGRPIPVRPTPWVTGGEQATHFCPTMLPSLDSPGPAAWVGSVTGLRGFVRLFVNAERSKIPIALLDPPLSRLRLDLPAPPASSR